MPNMPMVGAYMKQSPMAQPIRAEPFAGHAPPTTHQAYQQPPMQQYRPPANHNQPNAMLPRSPQFQEALDLFTGRISQSAAPHSQPTLLPHPMSRPAFASQQQQLLGQGPRFMAQEGHQLAARQGRYHPIAGQQYPAEGPMAVQQGGYPTAAPMAGQQGGYHTNPMAGQQYSAAGPMAGQQGEHFAGYQQPHGASPWAASPQTTQPAPQKHTWAQPQPQPQPAASHQPFYTAQHPVQSGPHTQPGRQSVAPSYPTAQAGQRQPVTSSPHVLANDYRSVYQLFQPASQSQAAPFNANATNAAPPFGHQQPPYQ
jgi:hypothetical protein